MDQASRFAPQHSTYSTLTNEFAQVRTGTYSGLIANLVPCSHARRPFRRLTSFLATVIAPCLIYSTSGSSVFDHGTSGGLMTGENSVSHEERPQRRFPFRGVPATNPLTEPHSSSADRRAPGRYPPGNIRFVQRGNQSRMACGVRVGLANAGARVSKVAGYRHRIASASAPARCLRSQNTCEGIPGYLATISHRRDLLPVPHGGRGR